MHLLADHASLAIYQVIEIAVYVIVRDYNSRCNHVGPHIMVVYGSSRTFKAFREGELLIIYIPFKTLHAYTIYLYNTTYTHITVHIYLNKLFSQY